jgi:hypothetical protein
MKIEIDIDIESIVKEALKKQQAGDTIPVPVEATNSRSKWEFSRRNGRRRTPEEMALHDLEKEKGRRLTPEEKGEAKALVEIDTTTENQVKEATIKKVRIDTMTAEGMAAASKELAEEERRDPDSVNGNGIMEREEDKKEAKIPKTDDLASMDSLFS